MTHGGCVGEQVEHACISVNDLGASALSIVNKRAANHLSRGVAHAFVAQTSEGYGAKTEFE